MCGVTEEEWRDRMEAVKREAKRQRAEREAEAKAVKPADALKDLRDLLNDQILRKDKIKEPA